MPNHTVPEASKTRPIVIKQRATLTAEDDSVLGADSKIKFGGRIVALFTPRRNYRDEPLCEHGHDIKSSSAVVSQLSNRDPGYCDLPTPAVAILQPCHHAPKRTPFIIVLSRDNPCQRDATMPREPPQPEGLRRTTANLTTAEAKRLCCQEPMA